MGLIKRRTWRCLDILLDIDWENISNTQNSVWPHFQVSRSSSKYCAGRRTFTSLLSVWKVFKHVFSCLISYNKKNHTGTVTIEAESLNGIPSKSWKTWRKSFGVIDFFHFTSENQPRKWKARKLTKKLFLD